MPCQGDWYGGAGLLARSAGFTHEFLVQPAVPVPATANPLTVTSYEIFQRTGGTAIAIVFYDLAVAPVDTTPLFGNTDPTQDAAFILPIAAPGTILYAPGLPGHTFLTALNMVATTALTNLTRANDNTLFTVHYLPYKMG